MKQTKSRAGTPPLPRPEDYGQRSSYNSMAVVGIIMVVAVVLCLTALGFYFYNGSGLKP